MKVKKIISQMLIGTMIVGLLAGCGAGGNRNGADAANQETQVEGQHQGEGEEAGNADTPETGEAGNAEAPDAEAAGIGDAENESRPADSNASSGQAVQGENGNTGSGTLIAYFSIPEDVDTAGVDAIAGASIVVKDSEVMGNTEYVAKLVQETIGGDLFRIETVEDYPLDHEPLVDQAAEEQDVSLRPELASHIENLDQYGTIILGYPNWWGGAPHIVYTLVEGVSLKGKTVVPFSTSISSGLGSSAKHLKAKAKISSKTKWLKGHNFYDVPSQKTVNKWVSKIK